MLVGRITEQYRLALRQAMGGRGTRDTGVHRHLLRSHVVCRKCHAQYPGSGLRGDLRGAASPAQCRGALARLAVPHTHVPLDREPAEEF